MIDLQYGEARYRGGRLGIIFTATETQHQRYDTEQNIETGKGKKGRNHHEIERPIRTGRETVCWGADFEGHDFGGVEPSALNVSKKMR
jgi:hypothetical protein